jgi:hypothetical protein
MLTLKPFNNLVVDSLLSRSIELKDSRGISFTNLFDDTHDAFIITSGYLVYAENYVKQMGRNRKLSYENYVFSILKEEITNIRNFFTYHKNKMKSEYSKLVYYEASAGMEENFIQFDIFMKQYMKFKYNGERVMPLMEISGKDILLGDLVLVFDPNISYSKVYCQYGICISDTQVLTQDNRLVKSVYVYKPLTYSDEELQLKDEMYNMYTKRVRSIKETQMMKTVDLGMVFTNDTNCYIYIGKCKFDVIYQNVSPYDFVNVCDGQTAYYLKLSLSELEAVKTGAFTSLLSSASHGVYTREKNKELILYDRLAVKYKEISFNLVKTLPKNAKYESKIVIPNQLVLTPYNIIINITY